MGRLPPCIYFHQRERDGNIEHRKGYLNRMQKRRDPGPPFFRKSRLLDQISLHELVVYLICVVHGFSLRRKLG